MSMSDLEIRRHLDEKFVNFWYRHFHERRAVPICAIGFVDDDNKVTPPVLCFDGSLPKTVLAELLIRTGTTLLLELCHTTAAKEHILSASTDIAKGPPPRTGNS
jgi:hypothetical protein